MANDGTREMVYFRNSRFTDVGVHEPILGEGNENAAASVSVALLRKWGILKESMPSEPKPNGK